MKFLLLVLLVLYNNALIRLLDSALAVDRLTPYTWESDAFRSLKLGKWLASQDTVDCEELASWMTESDFDLTDWRGSRFSLKLSSEHPAQFRKLAAAYRMLFEDLRYFPVPLSRSLDVPDVTYEDTWLQKRTYGGERGHEGCDLMGNKRPRGTYPVVSMTDGVVERVGWLEQGGWRIGIRSPSGVYFYYAHLSGYDREWQEGDPVRAGELLGYMGDSGYGKLEGTTGNFEVHLHVGIYLKTDHYEELSVNPYWLLRYLEKSRLSYWYE
ncbi:MAG: M23 family metallopeptidase [Lachnospiraceae bacterium]|jgi:murein DD-endopeptidase MepM/ murein hydrolase activator NlpD|nr:M23 family metallopeptidase [Lachnospiraceae bacterium]NBJ80455.1 M23 family metallopeptidase [bacterium 1XD42-76]NBK03664.1 M23 family metallopeptidase [bacterium 1XD42-94]